MNGTSCVFSQLLIGVFFLWKSRLATKTNSDPLVPFPAYGLSSGEEEESSFFGRKTISLFHPPLFLFFFGLFSFPSAFTEDRRSLVSSGPEFGKLKPFPFPFRTRTRTKNFSLDSAHPASQDVCHSPDRGRASPLKCFARGSVPFFSPFMNDFLLAHFLPMWRVKRLVVGMGSPLLSPFLVWPSGFLLHCPQRGGFLFILGTSFSSSLRMRNRPLILLPDPTRDLPSSLQAFLPPFLRRFFGFFPPFSLWDKGDRKTLFSLRPGKWLLLSSSVLLVRKVLPFLFSHPP